jgi:septal ring factor EnvC (AmiA/AmiB activator)
VRISTLVGGRRRLIGVRSPSRGFRRHCPLIAGNGAVERPRVEREEDVALDREEDAARRGVQHKLDAQNAALEEAVRRRKEIENAIEEAEAELRRLHAEVSEVYEDEGAIRHQIGELKVVLDAFEE